MQRRSFTLAMAAALALPAMAASDDEGPLVPAAKILDALTSKDIVLDRPGQPARPARPAARPADGPGIDLRVQFSFGSAELMPKGKQQLDELATALSDRALAGASFQLAGHTDAVGGMDANMRLSLARAEAVKGYLVAAHGLKAPRLLTVGFGYSRPVDKANPGAAVNRRVEVRRLPQGAQLPRSDASPATGGRLVPTPQR